MKFIESRGAYLIPWDSITNVSGKLEGQCRNGQNHGPGETLRRIVGMKELDREVDPKIGTNQTTPRIAFPQTSLLTKGFAQCRSSPTSRNAVTPMLIRAGTAISRTVDGTFTACRIMDFSTGHNRLSGL